jgi:pimeloyl-ACP methyl ester carboxylesterase
MTGLIYCSVIEACQQMYELHRAHEWTSALALWCEQQPEMVAFTGVCRVHRAEIMQLHGAWRDAIEEARRAGERCQSVNRQAGAAAFYQQAEVHRLRGEYCVSIVASADRVLAWLGELIERTCSLRPALVGQILGGAIAARFASKRSDRLSRLVLVDALGLAPFEPMPEFGLALMDFVTQPSEDTHDRLWQRCAFDLDRMRNRMGESWQRIKAYNLDRALTPSLQATQRALMEQFGRPAIQPMELAKIAIPTALIWGRHDLATRLEVAEAASARYGWPLHVIENAGDDPPMEQPEAFLKALCAALGDS